MLLLLVWPWSNSTEDGSPFGPLSEFLKLVFSGNALSTSSFLMSLTDPGGKGVIMLTSVQMESYLLSTTGQGTTGLTSSFFSCNQAALGVSSMAHLERDGEGEDR